MDVVNPAFDYVPPELVSLFITNARGLQPSYVYRCVHGVLLSWRAFPSPPAHPLPLPHVPIYCRLSLFYVFVRQPCMSTPTPTPPPRTPLPPPCVTPPSLRRSSALERYPPPLLLLLLLHLSPHFTAFWLSTFLPRTSICEDP